VAGARGARRRDGVGGGEQHRGNAAEEQQGGVRLGRHGGCELQPVHLSPGRQRGVLVAAPAQCGLPALAMRKTTREDVLQIFQEDSESMFGIR